MTATAVFYCDFYGLYKGSTDFISHQSTFLISFLRKYIPCCGPASQVTPLSTHEQPWPLHQWKLSPQCSLCEARGCSHAPALQGGEVTWSPGAACVSPAHSLSLLLESGLLSRSLLSWMNWFVLTPKSGSEQKLFFCFNYWDRPTHRRVHTDWEFAAW